MRCGVAGSRRKIVVMATAGDRAQHARRMTRASWPIKRFRLGEEPLEDMSAVTTPVERIAMMWPLAQSAWRLSGRRLPPYRRDVVPLRFFPPGARADADDA